MILSILKFSFRDLLGFVVGSLCLFSLTTIVVSSTTYGMHKLTPMSYWVDYKSVQSTKQVYSVYDTSISMKSNNTWKRNNIKVDWVDTLYCDLGNGFIFMSSVGTSGLMQKSDDTDISGEWVLNIPPPKKEAVCYVKSGITVKLGGVTKHQVINSNRFHVVDPLNIRQEYRE